jgi:hypothetical protein
MNVAYQDTKTLQQLEAKGAWQAKPKVSNGLLVATDPRNAVPLRPYALAGQFYSPESPLQRRKGVRS